MRWAKETEWNIVSDCKRYRITKAKAHTPWQLAFGEFVYQAWKDKEILHTGGLDACKEACRG